MKHPWRLALELAVMFAAIRLFSDLVIPPHLRWWFTPVIAGTASLATSAIWIIRLRAKRGGAS